jgi:hypothetical protein
MLIFDKADAHSLLHIILIISVNIFSHNWYNKLQSVSADYSNYQLHRTPLEANTTLWLNRLAQLPLCDRRSLQNTYYSNFDAAKKLHKADRPSLFRSLVRPYVASYDKYTVLFVSVHRCAKLVIWINRLSQVSPTLLLECKLPHFSHYEAHLNSVRKKNRNFK